MRASARIVHISDLHRGAVGFRHGMAELIQEKINDYQPDVVVITGDLTHRAMPEQFEQVLEFLQGLPFPLLLIPGNHDVPHLNPWTRLFTPFDVYRAHMGDDLEPVFSSENVVIAAVNTVRGGRFQQGRLGVEQLKRLETIFSNSTAAACRVLVTHHALVGPPGGRIKQPMPNRLLILGRLEEMGVNIVLSGHVHEAYCGSSRDFCLASNRGVVLCQAGLGTERPRPGWLWETNTFNCLEIDATTIRVEVYPHHPGDHAFNMTGEHRFPRWYPDDIAGQVATN
jgi:3',5'-cyclic AMP phosphodiesterase CpdA